MALLLRAWTVGDASALVRAADDPQVAKNLRNAFPHPYTLRDAQDFIAMCAEADGNRCLYRAMVVDGIAVGSISVTQKDDVYEKSAELGYFLARDYWNRGITTQSVRALCRLAFVQLPVVRIFAEPFACNIGSRRVLEKAGFELEGTLKKSVYKNGQLFDSCVYAFLKE